LLIQCQLLPLLLHSTVPHACLTKSSSSSCRHQHSYQSPKPQKIATSDSAVLLAAASSSSDDLPDDIDGVEVMSIGELMKSQRKLVEQRRKEKETQESQVDEVVEAKQSEVVNEAPLDILSSIENDIATFGPRQTKDALCR